MRFGAYGHLDDKLEFIENGVHSCIFYDVFDSSGNNNSSGNSDTNDLVIVEIVATTVVT